MIDVDYTEEALGPTSPEGREETTVPVRVALALELDQRAAELLSGALMGRWRELQAALEDCHREIPGMPPCRPEVVLAYEAELRVVKDLWERVWDHRMKEGLL